MHTNLNFVTPSGAPFKRFSGTRFFFAEGDGRDRFTARGLDTGEGAAVRFSKFAGIIVGMDNDDVHAFERTLAFLQENQIEAVQVNIMTPLPGTPLYESYKKSGRIIDDNYDHFDFKHVVFEPRRLAPRHLQEGADWFYAEFYRLDRVAARTFRTLRRAGARVAYMTWSCESGNDKGGVLIRPSLVTETNIFPKEPLSSGNCP